ncbi:MAG: hypothetical protein ACTSQ4_02295 [Candidatus Heimdallarchaeaceae archaeon]
MEKTKHKFGITIYSKYTGEYTVLGSQYDSYEEAQIGAENQVCDKCNRIEIIHIPEDAIWVDRKKGFISGKYLKKQYLKNENKNKS